MMNVKLILATEVKVGMYIEGNPGWWLITNIRESGPITNIRESGPMIVIDWEQNGLLDRCRYPRNSYVLVGLR